MINEKSQPLKVKHLLRCKIFGHKFRLLRTYKSDQKEYECAHCKQQFTVDEYGTLTPLTPKLRRINEVMEKFYIKKLQRQEVNLHS